jgi:hypothetical protein
MSIEAFVIVGSILLAFAIDAAWDRYREANRLAEYATALRGEFREARLEMVEQLDDRAYQFAAVDSLLGVIRDGERSDRLWAWVGQLRFIYVFGPSQPAFEALANSGGTELVIPPELRFGLLRYGQAKEFLEVLSARELQEWEDLTKPYLFDHTDVARYEVEASLPNPAPGLDPVVEHLYSDRYFRNLLVSRRDRISALLDMDQEVLTAIDEVLGMIVQQ